MFQKILIPLDGSPASERALDYLAHLHFQKILLARVYPQPSSAKEVWIALPESAEPADAQACLSYLKSLQPRLSTPLSIQIQAIPGEPAQAILQLAESEHCDLILMTSHARSGVPRFLLGSIAEKVTRYSTCPVLIVGRHLAAAPIAQAAQEELEKAQTLVEGCL